MLFIGRKLRNIVMIKIVNRFEEIQSNEKSSEERCDNIRLYTKIYQSMICSIGGNIFASIWGIMNL